MSRVIKSVIFLFVLLVGSVVQAAGFFGAFIAPGEYDIAGQRLLAGLKLAKPQQAYYLGGSLMRLSQRQEQQSLKDSVLYDLALMNGNALSSVGLKNRIENMRRKVTIMSVTGRIRAELNPEILVNSFAKNIVLKQGDQVFLPRRPLGIYVAGAVQRPGMFRSASGDMRTSFWMTRLSLLNQRVDWVWLAQADGSTHKIGVAKWNRTREAEVVMAPGAILYIPFGDEIMTGVEPGFDRRFIRWLATQQLTSVLGL